MLLALSATAILAAGIAPHDRMDWLLESLLPALLLVTLSLAWRRWRLSWRAYLAVFLLILIHELGAHFTYAQVPYEQWSQMLFGHSLDALMGWERNQYDRFVHFSYGLLMVIPLHEVLQLSTPLRRGWLWILALSLVLSSSALYELIEWIGGEYLGDHAQAFLATQQDPWDAQKDMALALVGALLTLTPTTLRALVR